MDWAKLGSIAGVLTFFTMLAIEWNRGLRDLDPFDWLKAFGVGGVMYLVILRAPALILWSQNVSRRLLTPVPLLLLVLCVGLFAFLAGKQSVEHQPQNAVIATEESPKSTQLARNPTSAVIVLTTVAPTVAQPPSTNTPPPTPAPTNTPVLTFTPVPPTMTPTPLPTPTPAPKPGDVLYEADWSKDMNGWVAGSPS